MRQFFKMTEKSVKELKNHNLKVLAVKSLKKFVKKAKEIKGDVILERLLDADEVIIDDNDQF